MRSRGEVRIRSRLEELQRVSRAYKRLIGPLRLTLTVSTALLTRCCSRLMRRTREMKGDEERTGRTEGDW
jgi:hypothetical protein